MNTALLVLLLVAAASAFPQAPTVVPVVERTEVRDLRGQFTLEYLSADGTKVTEKGHLIPNAKKDGEVLVKEGTVFYISPEGIPTSFSYYADEFGFHPVGEHFPRAPVV